MAAREAVLAAGRAAEAVALAVRVAGAGIRSPNIRIPKAHRAAGGTISTTTSLSDVSAMAEVETPPRFTARELLREIQRRGGRVYRFRYVVVICLTGDPDLAQWLQEMGGKLHVPVGGPQNLDGSYWRSKGVREWDVNIQMIPVRGPETVWEAAKRNRHVEMRTVE